MILSRATLKNIPTSIVELPDEKIFSLPEKVLQFGTGVFIRSFANYFIDKANKKGVFNGRAVVIKSTENGNSSEFDHQDGLYTICSKGIVNGEVKHEYTVNASISRVLLSVSQWGEILACAKNPEMKVVISNTTEVGIQLAKEKLGDKAPASFPGKLLAFLLERYKAFEGSAESGMVIVPTELIPDNGTILKQIIIELAHHNQIDEQTIAWLNDHNTFCNSLVDRIVPGKPGKEELATIQEELGYTDNLLSVSELFSLWAIEGDATIREALSFSAADSSVIINSNIDIYRELKLRLLNGTHTFNCGLAFLAGFNLTREAMLDKTYGMFASRLMHEEIAAAIPCAIDSKVKSDYANKVIERFCNPYINHQWISISAQFTSKMKMRNVPLLKRHYELFGNVPAGMVAGFAGYLLFMKSVKFDNGKYFGEVNGIGYPINDDSAAYFHDCWKNNHPAELVKTVLANRALWGMDLCDLNGFEANVLQKLQQIMAFGVLTVITANENKSNLLISA